MQRSRRVYRLVVTLVVVLTGVAFWGGMSEAAQRAPQALSGKAFSVLVTNCTGNQFDDAYCFTDNSMIVAALDCNEGPAQTIGPLFAGFVSDAAASQRVLFLGIALGNRISGTALEVTSRCKSTFTGQAIPECPCPLPAGEQEGTTPYKP
jgi:hypothetical protein